MITILIADDHQLFRQALGELLSTDSNFQVVALCGDSQEAIELIESEKPDIVFMDINIGPFSGIEATRKIHSFSASKVIALSAHNNILYAKNILAAGACGYLTKNTSREEIFSAVQEVQKGNKYLCKEIKNIASDLLMGDSANKPHPGLLTQREVQVVDFIKKGFSSKEIAVDMRVALKTVEVHRHNILKKLKLKNSSSLVNFMYENGGNLL